MQRRSFIKNATAGAAVAAIAAPAIGQAQAQVRWRLASSFPKALDTIYGAAEVFSKQVGAATGGRFQVSVHAAGELMPAFGVVDARATGHCRVRAHGAVLLLRQGRNVRDGLRDTVWIELAPDDGLDV